MTKNSLFPMADISGTSYEIGKQHGTLFRKQVLYSIESYKVMFKDYSDLDWDKAKEMAQRYIEPIRSYNPDYLDEMRGVADGAEVSFDDILTLNARSELALQGNASSVPEIDGCTSFVFLPEVTEENHTLVAHNWDWKESRKASMVMMNITQSNGKPTIHMITEAGIIGKTGFNSCGISVYLNALSVDSPPMGLPLHIAMRGILDSKTLSEAMSAAVSKPLGCCANFVIGSKEGEAVDIEIANDDFDVILPNDGVIVHTNHFLSPRLPRAPYHDTFKRKLPDTFLRQYRGEQMVKKQNGLFSIESIKEMLKSHTGFPDSICRHSNLAVLEGQRLATVFSIVIDLTASTMFFCPGSPCEEDFQVYQYND